VYRHRCILLPTFNMPAVTARLLCLVLGAFVIIAVLYSSTTLPSDTTRWSAPAAKGFQELKDKFKDVLPAAAKDPVAGDSKTTNPPSAALGVPDDSIKKDKEDVKGGKESDVKEDVDDNPIAKLAAMDKSGSEFNENKYGFQDDLDYDVPTYDAKRLKRYMPRNYHGPGNHTFATYYSTRNGTIHDPYFMSALQLTYRLLWDPKTKSDKYPLTIFIAPFVAQEQRDLLEAAGAIVRELDLVEWHPNKKTFARWRDLFSKLNMWRQTDFDLMAFLDLDAFPVQNIDSIFDIAERQKCRRELLPREDQEKEGEICDYVFSGTSVGFGYKDINVGVMVITPNLAMRERLVRLTKDTDKYDATMAEQAFLSYAFSFDGPFPPSTVGREWNGFFTQLDETPESGKLNIVHEKLWVNNEQLPWGQKHFADVWKRMLDLYNSKEFAEMREKEPRRPF
jgi:alpha-N-acetylglucosamine transferase